MSYNCCCHNPYVENYMFSNIKMPKIPKIPNPFKCACEEEKNYIRKIERDRESERNYFINEINRLNRLNEIIKINNQASGAFLGGANFGGAESSSKGPQVDEIDN